MKIINFGSLNIDKVCSVEEFVQPGETIMATGYSVNAGGKGLNQSVAAARAGAQVLHAGAVGSDGLFLKEILADAGADVSCLRVMDTESGCAFIEVNSKGQNRIIVSAGTNRMYTEEYIKNVLEKAEAGDFVLLQNEINMVGEIIRLSHEKGCRVVFNASPIPGKPEELPLELVDIFMVNELEAAALAGTSTEGDFRDILKALQKKYPKAAIVMTLGKEGVFYGYKEEFYSHPIFKVNAVDTTAAGDTFCGYFWQHSVRKISGNSVERSIGSFRDGSFGQRCGTFHSGTQCGGRMALWQIIAAVFIDKPVPQCHNTPQR